MIRHGKYNVLRKIADGAVAELFLAQMQGPQGFRKLVVLKRIRRGFSSDPQFRKMLIGEAHVAMRLSHGNIVQLLDLGESGGRYFLALELVDGWSLDQLLKRAAAAGLPFPRELAVHIVAQVCRALAYAHSRKEDGQPLGIVHRDISPHNILISEHGEVKLTDFGIAKARLRTDKTEIGVIKGKVAFMSPEQAEGATLDGRSDLFSLGVVLYQMATGQHPFEAPTDLETMARVQAAALPPLSKARPKLEPELAKFLEKALQRRPGARFASAEQMLEGAEWLLRKIYGGAGQSELVRWLQTLGRADSLPPISRQETSDAGGDDDEVVEEEVELTDSDLVPVSPAGPNTSRGERAAQFARATGGSLAPWIFAGLSAAALAGLGIYFTHLPGPIATLDAGESQTVDAGLLGSETTLGALDGGQDGGAPAVLGDGGLSRDGGSAAAAGEEKDAGEASAPEDAGAGSDQSTNAIDGGV